MLPLAQATLGLRLARCCLALALFACGAAAQTHGAAQPQVFATVGRTVVTAEEYEQALALTVRRRYYHGRTPEAQTDALRRAPWNL